MKHNLKYLLFAIIMMEALFSCKEAETSIDEDLVPNAKTSVTITTPSVEPISESIEWRATSQFQKKVAIKANATGYINEVTINIGDEVKLEQLLFTIKTKEARAIENQKIASDTSLNFSGVLKIKAQKTGIITTLDHQKGDYVQDGDELGIISERNSLVFILEVPFELNSLVKINGECEILLPDNQKINGIISAALPSVDAVAQTQSYVIKPMTELKLPENLIAKVKIIKSTKQKATILPKQSLLANETQTEFWVMKLLNDSTAIKVKVTKGIEENNKVEILSPSFNENDRIILTGNYGLRDTAKVVIQKGE